MEKLIVRSRKDIIVYCAQRDILMEDFNEPVTIAPDADVEGLFNNCTSFNQPVAIPSGTIKSCRAMFFRCKSFNQQITIPTGVTNCVAMFMGCTSLNQPIIIPEGVEDCNNMFMGCTSLNQPIIIPEGVEDCNNMFTNCLSFDQEMVIPTSVNNLSGMFTNCVNLNSPISILPKVELTKRTARYMFQGCLSLNSQIFFEDLTNIECMFEDCISFNQSMRINDAVRNANNVFKNCMNLNSPITIYIEPFEPSVVNRNNIFNKIAGMFEGCELFKEKIIFKIDNRSLQKVIGAPKFSNIELDVI